METFGDRLKILIKSSEIKSITNFSKKTHFSAVAISNVINGKSNPSFDFIIACLNVFPSVDLNWLISGERIAEKLELENRHLREKTEFYEKKLEKAAKLSSNRKSPELPFPEFTHFKSAFAS